jgi:phage terminase small subunit
MAAKLSPKQEAFCVEYIKDFNGTHAAIRAGYGKSTATSQASRLLTKDNVRARIAELTKPITKKAGVTSEYVITGLTEVVQRSLQRKAVMVWSPEEKAMVQATDENGEGVWQFDSMGANKALELLGKTMAMFTDKVKVSEESPLDYLRSKFDKTSD